MWMLAGLVTMIGMAVIGYRHRMEDRWKLQALTFNNPYTGTPMGNPPEDALYSEQETGSRRAPLQRIGFDQAPDIELRVKARRWWDYPFTAIGLSVACRTGNRAFDRAFYLVTDQQSLCRALTGCATTQARMLRLLEQCEEQDVRFRQLRVRRERIWVEVKSPRRRKKPRPIVLARAFVPGLREIAEALEAEVPAAVRGRREPFAWKAALFAGASTALLMGGTALLAPIMFSPLPAPASATGLLSLAFTLATVVVGSLMALSIALLGRTSRTHLVLLELALAGYLGALMTSYGLLREVNMAFDQAAPAQYVVEVQEKTTMRSSRGGTRRYLRVDGWDGPQRGYGVKVGGALYRSVREGDRLLLEEYPGRLGAPWIQMHTALPDASATPQGRE
ncbi:MULTISPECIES: hypothetical protein [unclassified Thioalkalivibrio]|uniref:hypothetical protein n=1 Tax=unclassified Thioalkalivibrio TaxID=2621013 RepID=UPI00037F36E9|nr:MULTISPECIES: hypothetical protein [unclassified Thioalkalivibrio]